MWTDRQLSMLEAMGLRLWLPSRSTESGAAISTMATAKAVPTPPLPIAVDARPGIAREVPNDRAAEPAEVSAMDLPALRRTVAGCTACRLCDSRRRTVPGAGHERAHWMVVGEAPGELEDESGEPFLGKPGQLLDNMLRSIGLERAPADADTGVDDSHPAGAASHDPARRVYLCNTVKCRPPGNRMPQPDEFARCEAYLIRQVELVQPRIILAMGQFAAQSLLRSTLPFGRLRGPVHRYQGVPLVATYHPAYLLRNPEDKAKAWDDLCLAVETVQRASAPGAALQASV